MFILDSACKILCLFVLKVSLETFSVCASFPVSTIYSGTYYPLIRKILYNWQLLWKICTTIAILACFMLLFIIKQQFDRSSASSGQFSCCLFINLLGSWTFSTADYLLLFPSYHFHYFNDLGLYSYYI